MKSERWVIRPWQQGDFALLAAAGPKLSERTLRLRFWGAVPTLPNSYLRSTELRWPRLWDAVTAIGEERELIGWAEYGRHPKQPDTADVAVCVIDAEQGHGVGTALVELLVQRARGAGLVSVHADIAPWNEPARRAWTHVTGTRAPTYALAG
jgi:RimJ/RimL family protein N-acetyltransferase